MRNGYSSERGGASSPWLKPGDSALALVDRHDRRFSPIDAAAFASKNLYNAALYLVRQAFIFEHRYLDYEAIYHQMKGHEAYQALPQSGSAGLRLLDKNWQSYFAACEAYREDPSKFRKPPEDAPLQAQDGWALRPGLHHAGPLPGWLEAGLIQPSMLPITIQTKQTRIAQVRIVPAHRLLCGGSRL